MKRFLQNIENALADSALLEMGVAMALVEQPMVVRESLEENFIEVAFAEAAEYEQIHRSILREHRRADDLVRPDDCHFSDSEACFV